MAKYDTIFKRVVQTRPEAFAGCRGGAQRNNAGIFMNGAIMKHLLLVLGLGLVTMFAVTTTAKANECLVADLNGDGAVDFSDFILFADAFGKSNQGECEEPPPPQPAANACLHLKELILQIYVYHLGYDSFAGNTETLRAEAFGVEPVWAWSDTLEVKIGKQAYRNIRSHVADELPRWNGRSPRRPPTPFPMYKRTFTIADSLLQCNAGPFRCLWIDEFVEYYSNHGERLSFRRADVLWTWFYAFFWFDGSQVVDQARDALRPLTDNENERPSFEKLKSVVKPILGCQ